MIVGGGSTTALHRHFVELAGGDTADVVCVPTAHPFGRWSGWCRRLFRRANVPRARRTVLHTRAPETADTEAFVEPLRTADAVWFTGGRQWRLVEAYAGTKALGAFWDVLRRGGVIGGSSAGASIQGSFLLRGDPTSKRILVGEYTEGFGFLPQSAIDQHIRPRDRVYDLIEVVEARPHLLGVGVDEGTAAVVRKDTLRVRGEGIVAIHDATRWQQSPEPLSNEEKVLLLQPGDRFNLKTRTVLPAPSPRPGPGAGSGE
jgi:cyanophycinase